MFLRPNVRNKDGKDHTYWSLVETVRTPEGQRQRTRVPAPEGEESSILCRSTARQAKEQAIHSRFSARMEKALTALAPRVAQGPLKDRNKIERRIGKIQARHPPIADLYEVRGVETSGALSVEWQALPGRQTWH